MASNFEQEVTFAIRSTLDQRIRQVAEEELARAQENIARRVREDIARLAIGVHQQYSVEFGSREIIIRVKHEGGR